jgi:hypothetical protein
MSKTKVDKKRIKFLVAEINDILSSGQGEDVPSRYHLTAVPKLFVDQNVTNDEKKALFKKYYKPVPDDATPDEIEWMMELCGVKKFKYVIE